jgi:GNAT superfamily N-acetyltransferase
MIKRIRKFSPEIVKEITNLIYNTFIYCNKKDSSKKLQTRMKYLFWTKEPTKETLKLFKESEIIIISKEKWWVNWVIRWSKNKIINLYVDERSQGKGIWKKLLERYIQEAKKIWSKNVFLKSSKYAYNFYVKQWFTIKNEKYLEKNI